MREVHGRSSEALGVCDDNAGIQPEPTMDLETFLTSVYCLTDDLLHLLQE